MSYPDFFADVYSYYNLAEFIIISHLKLFTFFILPVIYISRHATFYIHPDRQPFTLQAGIYLTCHLYFQTRHLQCPSRQATLYFSSRNISFWQGLGHPIGMTTSHAWPFLEICYTKVISAYTFFFVKLSNYLCAVVQALWVSTITSVLWPVTQANWYFKYEFFLQKG